MKKKRRILSKWSFQVGQFPKVTFTAREPFTTESQGHTEALMLTGVFKKLGDTRLKYIGRMSFPDKNGKKIEIDENGFVEYDRADISPLWNTRLDREMEDVQ